MTHSLLSTCRRAALALAIAIAGCGGGSPPDQNQNSAERLEMTGAVVGGDTTGPSTFISDAAAKGASGPIRTANPLQGSFQYAVSLRELTGPYALRAFFNGEGNPVGLVTLATAPGVANMTPLTNLMVAQLYGQEPEAAFNTYDEAAAQQVTEASLAGAQARVKLFLEEEFGVIVDPDVGDFVTSPFELRAGDPMFDTISALLRRLDEEGLTLGQLTTRVAQAARLCISEKITVTIAGVAMDFCPQSKSATPEEADSTVIAYVFDSSQDARLIVRARDGSVLAGEYTTSGGTVYSCSGAQCSGISLGTAAGNLTRPIVFASATWPSAGGGVVTLAGTLIGAAPGVVLPPLPCDVNRFYLVLADRQVKAECADIPAFSAIGFVGTFNTPAGGSQRWLFSFNNVLGENSLPPTDGTTLHVELEGDELVSITATRAGSRPNGFDIDYKCRGVDCNGVTVGPAEINTDFGFEIELRTITLDGTRLAAVLPDGTLSTSVGATATATLSTVGFDNVVAGVIGAPPTDCAAAPQSVLVKTTNDPFDYFLCADFSPFPVTTPAVDGGLEFRITLGTSSDSLIVQTNAAGAVIRVTASLGSVGHNFECTTECSGVTVSAPDVGGQRTVTFAGTAMRQFEPDGFATGDRTAVANGSYLAPAP